MSGREGSGPGQAVHSSLDRSLSGSVTLGKSHHLSGPPSPHLHNEEVGHMVSDSPFKLLQPVPSPVKGSSLLLCDFTDGEMRTSVHKELCRGPILAFCKPPTLSFHPQRARLEGTQL